MQDLPDPLEETYLRDQPNPAVSGNTKPERESPDTDLNTIKDAKFIVLHEDLERLARIARRILDVPVVFACRLVVGSSRPPSAQAISGQSRWLQTFPVSVATELCRYVLDSNLPILVETADDPFLKSSAGRTLCSVGFISTVAAVVPVPGVGDGGESESKERIVVCGFDRRSRTWRAAAEIEGLQDLVQAAAGSLSAKPSRSRAALIRSDDLSASTEITDADRHFVLSSDLLCVVDLEGRFLRVNPAWERVLGYSRDELLENTWLHFIHPEDRAATDAYVARLMSISDATSETIGTLVHPVVLENRYLSKDGTYRWLEWSLAPVLSESRLYASARDVTRKKEAEDLVRRQAFHDPLTDLPNRTLFEDRLRQALSVAGRRDTRVAVLFLDLDRFKQVNDTLGHSAGDRLLQEVSRRLLSCLRGEDTVARLGGDEFIILLPGIDRPEDAARVARKILKQLQEPFVIEGEAESDVPLTVTSSIGISVFPHDGDEPAALIKHADIAMYQAKSAGRNGYELFSNSRRGDGSGPVILESSLRVAVERGEFLLQYQPQIGYVNRTGRTGARSMRLAALDGTILGVEALLRWRHPEHGIVSPNHFIPLAEETGLIVPIGEWVLREACHQAALWHRAGWSLRMSVNVSAQQLAQAGATQMIAALLESEDLPPSLLDLELTESTFISDDASVLNTLDSLRALGVRLSVDDFGTGYSSLSYLRRFPLTTVKVDRSFVAAVAENAADEAVVRAVVDLSHTLKMEVVAEGVETEAQRDVLWSLGCDAIQGFLISRPLSPVDVEMQFRK